VIEQQGEGCKTAVCPACCCVAGGWHRVVADWNMAAEVWNRAGESWAAAAGDRCKVVGLLGDFAAACLELAAVVISCTAAAGLAAVALIQELAAVVVAFGYLVPAAFSVDSNLDDVSMDRQGRFQGFYLVTQSQALPHSCAPAPYHQVSDPLNLLSFGGRSGMWGEKAERLQLVHPH